MSEHQKHDSNSPQLDHESSEDKINEKAPKAVEIEQFEDKIAEEVPEAVERDQCNEEASRKNETWEWLKAIAIAVVIAFCIRTFIFSPIVVDGPSMESTLFDGEKVIINKAVYMVGAPKYGDIIVFEAPSDRRNWIKRIIGLPGDTVEMRGNILYINGEAVEELYIDEVITSHDFQAEVPEGYYFVMGDNRNRSRDSRHIGPISDESIKGRAEVVFLPLQQVRKVH
jgi:signal peptidase I